MRHPLFSFGLFTAICCLALAGTPDSKAADDKDSVLFDFAVKAMELDWVPVKLPEVAGDQPAPKVEIIRVPKAKSNSGSDEDCLQITFDGGDWPTVGTSKLPMLGTWKEFQTLKANLTVDRPSVAYFRIYQGKPDDKPQQPRWEKTMMLQPGRNEVTLMIRIGIGSMDAGKGAGTSFIIGMFKPEKGQKLLVSNVRLSPEW